MLQRRTNAASWRGTSPSAQPRDDSACRGKQLFVMRRVWGMAAIAHRFKRRIDLAECGLGHSGVLAPHGKEHQCDTLVAKADAPLKWHAFAGSFLQRLPIGGDRLFEPFRPALSLPETEKGKAQIVLGHGPVKRPAFARPFLQRLAIGDDSLFEFRRSAFTLPERR